MACWMMPRHASLRGPNASPAIGASRDPQVLALRRSRSARTAGGRLEKLNSSPAFHLKGSGWYATHMLAKVRNRRRRTTKDAKDTKDAGDKSDKMPSERSEKKESSDSKPAADDRAGKAPTKDTPKPTS